MRKITIGEEVWEYNIGKSYINIRGRGKRHNIGFYNLDFDLIENVPFKTWHDWADWDDRDGHPMTPAITPKHIRQYIEENLIK